MLDNAMDSLNAKRMTADQVARTFVESPDFLKISSQDNVYVIGPRGSGKTTLLRMLTDESLMAWQGPASRRARSRIGFSSVFVPADELWASQSSLLDVRAAFSAQLLLAVVGAMMHRVSGRENVHIPAALSSTGEARLATHLGRLWGFEKVAGGFDGLMSSLELFLAGLPRFGNAEHALSVGDPLRLAALATEAFNRAVDQVGHKWTILLDEMELAPAEVHGMVTAFVRGGSPGLTLKISMSPFDRYMEYYGDGAKPAPGHDFQTVYLSGQPIRDIRALTNGLWAAALKTRGLPHRDLNDVLNAKETSRRDETASNLTGANLVRYSAQFDATLQFWLKRRRISIQDLENLSYMQNSATIRKIVPLLTYRDALLNFRQGKPVLRSRKKSFEPFTGAVNVARILEGNPRWIKSAFSQMLEYYDPHTGVVTKGFQLDALQDVATRFESLLRVLPTRQNAVKTSPPLPLVDDVARYLRKRNLTDFSPDAPNSFIVDKNVSKEVKDGLLLALYAGAIVHLRDKKSPAVLSSFTNQRFRLTYLLSVRDGKELPLRLGKDVSLSTILESTRPAQPKKVESELALDWDS